MGHGTGVLRALLGWYAIRGLTVGISATCGLFISRKSGVPQNNLVAARGAGCTLAPVLLGFAVGRVVWSGNSQVGVAAALACKMLCELAIPNTDSALALYTAFFFLGVSMALLDTFTTVLMSKAHGRRVGTALVLYDTVYGMGCMIAPFIAVMDPTMAWRLLAMLDFLLGAAVIGKRLYSGKPRDWKLKIRGPAPEAGSALGAINSPVVQAHCGPPARVVRLGMAFTFMVQFTMTAVSCWGFTYASLNLGVPAGLAATIPGSFYAACTLARFLVAPATVRFRPSVIIHVGILLTVVAAVSFYILDGQLAAAIAAGASAGEVASYMPMLLVCFMAMGAGFCPHYSLMIAAMQEHGDLAPHQHGWYGTCTCLGITAGMWLPGFVRLPIIELVGSICLLLMINTHARDFPRGFAIEDQVSVRVTKCAEP